MTNEELVTEIQNGNLDLMEQLWRQCYGFIRQQAIRWYRTWESRPGFDVDDLTQSGYIALCKAAREYEPGPGKFLTYLSYPLRTAFACVTGCRTSKKEPLDIASSLDAPAYSDTDTEITVGENIPIDELGYEAVEESVFNSQLANILGQAIDELPKNQGMVIDLHYLQGQPYRQIAEGLQLSRARIGQLAEDGLKSIKERRYAPILSEMLYGDRNYYRHTGYTAWKSSGLSSPELELIRKENWRCKHIRRYMQRYGVSFEQANQLFLT